MNAEGMNERGKEGVWLLRDLRTQRGSDHNLVTVCWQNLKTSNPRGSSSFSLCFI